MTDSAHVVIVGAGFAGLSAVGGLRKAGLKVTVIDKNLYSTFQPLLYQVATGGLNPGDVAYPVGGFTGKRHARYIRGELAASTRRRSVVRLTGGREVGYDYLILATGVSANYFGVKGAAENTFGLYTRADAIVLRDHIMNGFEWLSADPDGQREFAVTVVGGGATGVELAGTLGELRSAVLRATFPDVDPERMHIRLVEMAPELLMPFHPKLRDYTRRQLVARGVDIRLGTEIRAVTADSVLLGDGPGAAQRPHRLDGAGWPRPGPWPTGACPRARAAGSWSEPDLRVQGRTGSSRPATSRWTRTTRRRNSRSPHCRRAGTRRRRSCTCCAGEPTEPFRYHDKGIMATIGRRSAVVQLARGTRITGTLAWFAWLGLHLFYLLGNRNRIATLINLSWRYIAWGHGGGVIVGDEPTEPLHRRGRLSAGRSRPVPGLGRPDRSGPPRASDYQRSTG